MAAGLFVLGIGGYWMSRLNLEISPWQIVWPRVVFIMGLSTIFAPLNVAAFMHNPPQLRGAAVGFNCPEWSHLSAGDSVEFSKRLVPHLRKALRL
jgi:hypothetical protein